MRDYDRIISESIRRVLNEEELKSGQTFRLPFAGAKGMKILSKKYGVPPTDFYYDQANNYFVYKPKKKPKKKKSSLPKGRPEGLSDEEYLELVRRENEAFRNAESEIEGEEWRPIRNSGRYFGGTTDYARTHEISNMGRIRTIDFKDPMRSRISTGYDAPTRSARQFHLDSLEDNGESRKTTPPIHTMVADAWLKPPEGDISAYDVEHIDGDYHNNRADNLRYVLRKGRRGKNKKIGESMNRTIRLTENDLHRVIAESVKHVLREWQFDNDLDYQRIADEAYDYMEKNNPSGYDWRDVAEGMGYRMESIGPNDMETLKDAIEDAMHDYYVYTEEIDNREADYGESIH